MPRPPIEGADIVRAAGKSFFESSRKWFTWLHLKVLYAILRCRTAALAGHLDACSKCGYEAVSYNRCRNRHCPKCQVNARDRWLEARGKELLPTRYVHVVFTLPRQLSPLVLRNKREIYALLFRPSAATLLEVARDPKRLGAEIGFFSILHTWNQKLQHHPHVRCVAPVGGLLRTTRGGSTRSRTFSCQLPSSKKCSGASSSRALKPCSRRRTTPQPQKDCRTRRQLNHRPQPVQLNPLGPHPELRAVSDRSLALPLLVPAWRSAEQSAADPTERERMPAARTAIEEQRLDSEEAERRLIVEEKSATPNA